MGDSPIQPGTPAEIPRQEAPAGVLPMSSAVAPDQASSLLQHHHGGSPQDAFSSQLDMAQAHGVARGGSFDMSAMANAVPQTPYRPGPYGQGQHRYNAIAVPSPVSPFATQAAITPVPGQQYYLPPHGHGHVAHFYPTPLSPQSQTSIPPRPDLGYYQNAAPNQPPHPASQYYYPQATHFAGQTPQLPGQVMSGQYSASIPPHVEQRQPQSQPRGSPIPPEDLDKSATEGRRSIVRGPPRKPRQSGHAIWIGNLPPQTDLMTLVHHVCKEAEGLESLFLISKSNCAFANFRDEEASVAAQRKLHDSKFLTVRLVSRLRKSTVEGPAGVTAPTGPAAATLGGQSDSGAEQPSAVTEGGDGDGRATGPGTVSSRPRSESSSGGVPVEGAAAQKDRFFILKSLTVEDIELSVKTNLWATQSHNEEVLNKAFKNSDNVYLIFSANKSGEYFGYARMVSPINHDPEAAIEFAPKAQLTSDVELPKAIPTEATEFAPKGRIIDDSARGTIFWEAEEDDAASGSVAGAGDDDGSPGGSVSGDTGSVKSVHEGIGGESKAWGKPFRLEWLSTARLPFYRTRGLRNAWNSNREVKIARDGTELEPTVGRKLIGLFNRAQSPSLAVPGHLPAGMASGGPRGPAPMVPYQPMR